VFLFYPTIAPRPDTVAGNGFAAWGLRARYDADPPYNCFPSIHVAHSFVSALACHRVHRRLGVVTLVCAAVVVLATLLTKQHYVADALGGVALALLANAVWMRGYPRANVPDEVTRVAPALAVCVGAFIAICLAGAWAIHLAAAAAGLLR
jgi:membrane-associated phospholipid phosphatase